MTRPRSKSNPLDALEIAVLNDWRAGLDTHDIARRRTISESIAARIIARDQDHRHAARALRNDAERSR